jgi:porphobilinogen synthase
VTGGRESRGLVRAGLLLLLRRALRPSFASVFYGPFREAAESTPQFGDRRSYQMDPANGREAMREIELDLEEGADMIMVKPAMPYLDVIREARDRFEVPLGAYQVSGEFSMLVAAIQKGWLDRDRAILESLTSIRLRAARKRGCGKS